MIEQFPQLIAKIQENNSGPTQNLQLISIEQRPTATINVVTRSGATTQIQHSQKQPVEVRARKASVQVPALNTAQDQALVKVAPCNIVDPHTPAVPAQQPHQASQPQDALPDKVSTLSSFLQSCMKLLRN